MPDNSNNTPNFQALQDFSGSASNLSDVQSMAKALGGNVVEANTIGPGADKMAPQYYVMFGNGAAMDAGQLLNMAQHGNYSQLQSDYNAGAGTPGIAFRQVGGGAPLGGLQTGGTLPPGGGGSPLPPPGTPPGSTTGGLLSHLPSHPIPSIPGGGALDPSLWNWPTYTPPTNPAVIPYTGPPTYNPGTSKFTGPLPTPMPLLGPSGAPRSWMPVGLLNP